MGFLFNDDDDKRPMPVRPKSSRFRKIRTSTSYTRGSRGTRVFGSKVFVRLKHERKGASGNAAAAKRLAYLARESAAGHVGGVKIVGNVDPQTFVSFVKNEKRIFRLEISPEEYFSMDVEAFLNSFMARVQREAGFNRQGQKFDWAGFVHTNTQNPHAHLLIRGVDHDGEDVYIPPEVVVNLPSIAKEVQDILTGGLEITDGIRRERMAARQLRRVKPPAETEASLDTIIGAMPKSADYNKVLHMVPAVRRRALHARLITLEKSGLLTLDEGSIDKVPNFDREFLRVERLLDDVAKENVLRFSKPGSLEYMGIGYVGSPLGVLTALIETTTHGLVAVMETYDHKPLVLTVPRADEALARTMLEHQLLVTSRRGQLLALTGDPRDRFKRMGRLSGVPSGVVAAVIDSYLSMNGPLPQSLGDRFIPVDPMPRQRPRVRGMSEPTVERPDTENR